MRNCSYLLIFIIIFTLLSGCQNNDAFGTIPQPVEIPTNVPALEIKKLENLAPTAYPTPTRRPKNTPTVIPTLAPNATTMAATTPEE